jgi:hypothetical protein
MELSLYFLDGFAGLRAVLGQPLEFYMVNLQEIQIM